MSRFAGLPPVARPIAAAADDAVRAAGAGDAAALDGAVAVLARFDPAQVGLLLGTVVRLALEERHPDGIGADEVRGLLTEVGTAGDPRVFLALVAGALGVHPADEAPPPRPDVQARHAALLVAHLLGGRPFAPALERAAREIARTTLDD